jgi:hypothetical protein
MKVMPDYTGVAATGIFRGGLLSVQSGVGSSSRSRWRPKGGAHRDAMSNDIRLRHGSVGRNATFRALPP